MNKLKTIKVIFKPIHTKDTEAILDRVYGRLFNNAFKNIMARKQKEVAV